ncbi:MAG: protein kinase [Ignavibacterium album]|nr:protein kinase [Ignavibacterium album]
MLYTKGSILDNKFQIVEVIDQGGVSNIYICKDLHSDEEIVLKTLKGRFSSNKKLIVEFKNEVLTWIALGRHPNIVRASRLSWPEGRPHLVLDYISGIKEVKSDLRDLIKKKKITRELLVNYAWQICNGMKFVNRRIDGFVHRDIKPDNILVGSDGIIKITDFGLSKILLKTSLEFYNEKNAFNNYLSDTIKLGKIVGTFPYMSPEQCKGEKVDQRSDIYSFGCVLFEMYTGRTVFNLSSQEDMINDHLNTKPSIPLPINKERNTKIEQIILKCLSKSPNKRYQSFEEIEKVIFTSFPEIISSISMKVKKIAKQDTSINQSYIDLMNQAMTFSNLGSRLPEYLDQAILLFEKAIDLKSDQYDAYANLAITYQAKGWYKKAIAYFDISSEIILQKKEELPLWKHLLSINLYNKGNLFCFYTKDFKKALKYYNESIDLNPNDGDTWCNLGYCNKSLSNYKEAISCFNTAIKLNPKHARAYNGLGSCYFEQKNYHMALLDFLEAVEIDPYFEGAKQNILITRMLMKNK